MQPLSTALLIERPLIHATLYELASIVFSSKALAELSSGDDRDEFERLRVRHEIAMATKLLVEVAVILRNLLDGDSWPMDVIHATHVESRPEVPVGELVQVDKTTELPFREACNKLIHSERISFGMSDVPGKMAHLDGIVEAHGRKGSKKWVATIRVADFIRMATRQL